MKTLINVKENAITTKLNLPDGTYEIDVKEKDKTKTLQQVRKLWATIDDISRHEYGDISQSQNIYFQILKMAGIETDKLAIPESALPHIQKKFRAVHIVSNEVINHIPYVVIQICYKGLSEMTKKEASQVIDTAIRWCSELGIETDLGGEIW